VRGKRGTYVASGRLGWAGDHDNLAALEAVVARDRVRQLDPRELRVLQPAAHGKWREARGAVSVGLADCPTQGEWLDVLLLEQECLVVGTEDVVFRNEGVLGNVDEQVRLGERA